MKKPVKKATKPVKKGTLSSTSDKGRAIPPSTPLKPR